MNQLIEIQTFKGNRAVWVLILMLGALPLLLYTLGWSRMKSFDFEEIGLIAITILTSTGTIAILLNIKTFVRLEKSGLSYKSKPFLGKLRSIDISNIEHWTIQDYKWKQGLGYQRKYGGHKSFVLQPGKALVIKLTDGREFTFGINRPALIKTFISRNWEQKTAS